MILLDTHILVWLLIAPENLSPKAKKAILAARKSGPLALSAISLWEIAWLAVNERIDIDVSVDCFVKKCASYARGYGSGSEPGRVLRQDDRSFAWRDAAWHLL